METYAESCEDCGFVRCERTSDGLLKMTTTDTRSRQFACVECPLLYEGESVRKDAALFFNTIGLPDIAEKVRQSQ